MSFYDWDGLMDRHNKRMEEMNGFVQKMNETFAENDRLKEECEKKQKELDELLESL